MVYFYVKSVILCELLRGASAVLTVFLFQGELLTKHRKKILLFTVEVGSTVTRTRVYANCNMLIYRIMLLHRR